MTGLEGAGIALAAVAVSRLLPSRGRKPQRPKLPEPPKAICGCTHHFSVHDPQTRACTTSFMAEDKKFHPCACKQYTGPEPMPQYIP